jgi:hypothetical protein
VQCAVFLNYFNHYYLKQFTMKALLKIAAFFTAIFALGSTKPSNTAQNNTATTQGIAKGASAATQRTFGHPQFYKALRYKRGKNGKVKAWS